ncbi:hypothetical protein [Hankyongella ginsenosidimutans]|uniref:hypothetical protein n=1 Tax=Hankyongella ginsenosidimutans TaxID=1763828 RepID=UPI001FEC4D25|nr:hypothetical protein [Hankyongella ginsenosidimutans]
MQALREAIPQPGERVFEPGRVADGKARRQIAEQQALVRVGAARIIEQEKRGVVQHFV